MSIQPDQPRSYDTRAAQSTEEMLAALPLAYRNWESGDPAALSRIGDHVARKLAESPAEAPGPDTKPGTP